MWWQSENKTEREMEGGGEGVLVREQSPKHSTAPPKSALRERTHSKRETRRRYCIAAHICYRVVRAEENNAPAEKMKKKLKRGRQAKRENAQTESRKTRVSKDVARHTQAQAHRKRKKE